MTAAARGRDHSLVCPLADPKHSLAAWHVVGVWKLSGDYMKSILLAEFSFNRTACWPFQWQCGYCPTTVVHCVFVDTKQRSTDDSRSENCCELNLLPRILLKYIVLLPFFFWNIVLWKTDTAEIWVDLRFFSLFPNVEKKDNKMAENKLNPET